MDLTEGKITEPALGIGAGESEGGFLTASEVTGLRRNPGHVWIEPDRQAAEVLQGFVVDRPVLGLVARLWVSAHSLKLSRWFHEMNPSQPMHIKAPPSS